MNPNLKVIKRLVRSIWTFAILILATSATTSLKAQLVEFRPIPGFHWSSHLGITTYAGEFDASSIDRSAVGFGLSNALTYQLSQSFGIGMGHTLALHPRIPDPSTRHNVQAFFIAQHPRQRVTPFVKFGLSNTIGGETLGFGPHFGFGLNIISSGTFSLFQETTVNMVFPGRAVDGQDLSGGFDSIGTVGVGIRITDLGGFFGTRSIGLEEIFSSAEATEFRVKPGESVRFSSSAKDEKDVEFVWNFGDGINGLGKSVDHVFEQTGLYEVSLSAQNAGVTEERSVFISVQDEAPIAGLVEINEPDSPNLRASDVDTIEGPVIESRSVFNISETQAATDPDVDQESEPIAIAEVEESDENIDSEVEEEATIERPKRTRVIILDGVRIEEEIPEDELVDEPENVTVVEPIDVTSPSTEIAEAPVDQEVIDALEEEIPVVIEIPDTTNEMVQEQNADVQEAETPESLEENIEEGIGEMPQPEIVKEEVEEAESSPIEESSETPTDTNIVESEEPIESDDLETTIIIVDGKPVEVEVSSLEETSAEEPNDETSLETSAPATPIDREKLEEGVYTWVLAVFEDEDEATSTANKIGLSTFVLEIRPEHEMFSIFSFQTQDRSARVSFLTTYGSFDSKDDAINAMDTIPDEFQARPFMIEVRRF